MPSQIVCTVFAELQLGQDKKVLPCFEHPQKSHFKSNHQKINTCQIFLPKKILESKISNPQKSFYYAVGP